MESSRPVADSSRSPRSEEAPARRELKRDEIPGHIENLSRKATRFLKYILDKCTDLIEEFTKDSNRRKDTIMCFVYLSITSTVAHIIIQGGIMSKYVDDEIFGLMTAFLCVICVFAFFNFCLISPFSSLLGKPSCLVENLKRRLVFYFISLSLYLGLLYDVASFLRKNDSDHFIASLVVFFLSVNIHGMVLFVACIVSLVYRILYWCCKFILYLTLKFCCNTKEVEIYLTIYSYDPSKTNKETCTICRKECERSDQICVCKIDLAHIFHENCIFKHFFENLNCPRCGGNQDANFH